MPPRPSVVISLVSWLTPWNPATITTWPSSSAVEILPGVTSMILARPCTESVITPAWDPVKERAVKPRSEIAMATRAIEIRSPAVSSMSSSRAGGSGLTSLARSSSSSVESPIAETATTTSWPLRLLSTIRRATRLTLAASAREEPPYFCTTMPTKNHSCARVPDRPESTGGQVCGSSTSSTASAASIWSCSDTISASSRSWATTDSRALRAAPARLPQLET